MANSRPRIRLNITPDNMTHLQNKMTETGETLPAIVNQIITNDAQIEPKDKSNDNNNSNNNRT